MMERGIQIKGAEDPDPRAFDTDAVLVSQEEIEEQFAQVGETPDRCKYLLPGISYAVAFPCVSVPGLARFGCLFWQNGV